MTTLFGLIHVTKANTLRNFATVNLISVDTYHISSLNCASKPASTSRVILTITREPVPHKRPDEHVKEVSIPRDRPSVALGRICLAMIVEGIDECSIHKSTRPNHGCRFHKIFTHQASDSKTNALRCDGQQNVEAPAKVLSIKASLSNNGVGKVADTTPKCCISHDYN